MNSRVRLSLGSLAVSSALVLACSSAKHTATGATGGAGAEEEVGGATSGGGGAPDSVAGQAASEHGGSSDAGSSASGGPSAAGKTSTGGGPSGGAPSGGAENAGSAGSEQTPGDAGAGGGQGPASTLLKNPGFELGSLVGWKVVVTPSSAGKSVFAQYPVGDAKAVDGNYEVAFWNGNSAFTGALEQTVTNLSPGKYQLKVYIAFGTGINAAYLYAIDCGLSNSLVELPIIDTVPTFTQFMVPEIDVTGTSCTVGLFADMATGNWLNADAFVFESVPAG
jgi:hypothetical protein